MTVNFQPLFLRATLFETMDTMDDDPAANPTQQTMQEVTAVQAVSGTIGKALSQCRAVECILYNVFSCSFHGGPGGKGKHLYK